GIGHFIQINDVDALQLGDLVQVEIVRHHASAQHLGEHHQPLIHTANVAQFGQIGLVDLQLDLVVVLQPLQHIQPPPAAIALELVGTVGNALQLLQHKPRHDQLAVDDSRVADVGDAAVDNDTGVQSQGAVALHLFRKLHVRNDEAKFVFGLQ